RLSLQAETIVADTVEWPGASEGFDGVLVDAPCTSTGTIRRHPDVAWLRQEGDIAPMTALQKRLLQKAATLLKPGGTLVYCTCSLEPEEGEGAISALIAAESGLRRVPIDPAEVAGLAEIVTPAGDLRTADATRAAEIYAGRFVFAGKIVTCHGRSIFDLDPPSEDWEVALLGFGWLRHLRAADTALTRANARSLVDDWMSNPTRRRPLERRADVLARRVISLLSQAPLVLGDTDGKFYRRYLRGLTREIRYLRYAMIDIGDGVPKLQMLIALCYASLCLANQAKHIRNASRTLSDELQRQILPDGGHISRNPGALVELLSDLLPLRQTFAARNIAPPPALLNAIDRMMPMLRFFRHGDGSFSLFNGMSSAPNDLVATLLAYDDTHGAPMANMPHTGYQRIDAGAMILLIDTGAPPQPSVSHDAHAGCLSFELSSGPSRIVINCGMPSTGRDNW